MAETFAYHILLYLQIAVNEIGAIDAVCHDSAHESSCKNDIFRTFRVEKPLHGHTVEQVEFGMRAAYKIRISFRL